MIGLKCLDCFSWKGLMVSPSAKSTRSRSFSVVLGTWSTIMSLRPNVGIAITKSLRDWLDWEGLRDDGYLPSSDQQRVLVVDWSSFERPQWDVEAVNRIRHQNLDQDIYELVPLLGMACKTLASTSSSHSGLMSRANKWHG